MVHFSRRRELRALASTRIGVHGWADGGSMVRAVHDSDSEHGTLVYVLCKDHPQPLQEQRGNDRNLSLARADVRRGDAPGLYLHGIRARAEPDDDFERREPSVPLQPRDSTRIE